MRPDSILSVGRGENRVQRQNNTERAGAQIADDMSAGVPGQSKFNPRKSLFIYEILKKDMS